MQFTCDYTEVNYPMLHCCRLKNYRRQIGWGWKIMGGEFSRYAKMREWDLSWTCVLCVAVCAVVFVLCVRPGDAAAAGVLHVPAGGANQAGQGHPQCRQD